MKVGRSDSSILFLSVIHGPYESLLLVIIYLQFSSWYSTTKWNSLPLEIAYHAPALYFSLFVSGIQSFSENLMVLLRHHLHPANYMGRLAQST